MRGHGHAGQASGQTLPLFALMVPVMAAMLAFGLDGAQIFLERRDAQSAADLAALSAAIKLPDEPNAAKADAKAVGQANGYQASQVVAVTPYGGDNERIEVTVNSSVTTFFMPILAFFSPGDFSTVEVSARAVAESTEANSGYGQYAIFALETCPSLEKSVDISGSEGFFVGDVHSNSDIHVSGSDMDFQGNVTSVCGNGYPAFHDGGSGNTYDPAPTTTTVRPDPIGLTRADFTCDFLAPSTGMWDLASDGVWWVGGTKTSKTLRAGTYCSRGSDGGIQLGDSDIVIETVCPIDDVNCDVASGTDGVTFVVQHSIAISGSNFDLHPHEHDVLFFSEGNTDVAIKVSGSGGAWEGIMYAPNGTAEVSGQDNFNYTGGIVAERVKLNGSDSSINAGTGGPAVAPQKIALVE